MKVYNKIVNAAPDALAPPTGIEDTSYSGTYSSYFILPATFGMDSVNKGLFYVKDGIRKQHRISTLDFANPWMPDTPTPYYDSLSNAQSGGVYGAGFNNGGPININARLLQPQNQLLWVMFNPRDLELTQWAEAMSDTLLARELPNTVETWVTYQIVRRGFEQVENELWIGSQAFQASSTSGYSSYTNPKTNTTTIEGQQYFPWQIQYFDGVFCKIFGNAVTQTVDQTYANYNAVVAASGYPVYVTNDPNFTQVPNGTLPAAVSLNSSNIGDAFLNLYEACAKYNKALLANPKKYERLKFIVSINTATIYEDFLTTQPFKNNDTTDAGIMRYKGYSVVPVAGLPDNTIVFTEALNATDGNLFFGLNSEMDENFQLKRTIESDELFALKMLMKMDVNYGFGNKLFIYTTLTSSAFTGQAFS